MAATSVTVLCPNARRVNVKTTPNTSILQILEEACAKQKYNPDLYFLKHIRRNLDVGTTLRFAGVPNRCVLEMAEMITPRTQLPVTVCVVDEEGGKHVQQHQAIESLWSVLEASGVLQAAGGGGGLEPSVVFSMRRVAGQQALSDTTLKMLGLNSGKGSLRFLWQKLDDSSSRSQQQQQQQQIIAPNRDASLPEVIPVQRPEIIPVAQQNQPEVIPVINQPPGAIPVINQPPEIIPVINQPPEIIPVVNQPEVIPVNVQPEIIPHSNQPEIIPVNIQPEIIPNVDGSGNPNSIERDHPQDIVMADNSVGGAVTGRIDDNSPNAEPGLGAGVPAAVNILSPDVVSSSQGSLVPDVVMRRDDSSSTPDVLNNDCLSSSTVAAFTGSGRTLSAASCLSSSNNNSNSLAPSSHGGGVVSPSHLPSQMMEVDSTQDTAVIALRAHDAVVFRTSDASSYGGPHYADEDDDFYKLTSEDVRRQHREQVRRLRELDDCPMLTKGLREAEEQSKLLATINKFPVTQLRIHFPDDMVVQASFRPSDTVQDVAVFVVGLLNTEAMEFDLMSHYPRNVLDRSSTLYGAGLVPKARIHCCIRSNGSDNNDVSPLQPSVLSRVTSYQLAQNSLVNARDSKSTVGFQGNNNSSSLASGAGPSNAATEAGASSSSAYCPLSTGATTKKPKWFKLGK